MLDGSDPGLMPESALRVGGILTPLGVTDVADEDVARAEVQGFVGRPKFDNHAPHAAFEAPAERQPAPETTALPVASSEELGEESSALLASEVATGLDPERALLATSWQTFIYEKPDFNSRRIGYLRSGTTLAREAEPAGFKNCKRGFYRVEPEGFVCVGKAATLNIEHPLAMAPSRAPKREMPLPYRYAETGPHPPHRYTRLPTPAERVALEPIASSLAKHRGAVDGAVPEFLAEHAPSLRSNGERMSSLVLSSGQVVPRSSFALVQTFENETEAWGITTDLLLLPLKQLRPVEVSAFKGLELRPSTALPVVFVMERHANLFEGSPKTGLRFKRRAEYREAFPLSGASERTGGVTYLETRAGQWLIESERLIRVEARSSLPHWAKPGRTWLDVSIRNQTLVAYVGAEPVYATLVSTGKDGLGDPESTHATVLGEFLIHTKHVTDAMSNDQEGDIYDHQDVPYIQFFKDGYALHAAYWHDDFGKPKSHGCINLSPQDARWLFAWSDPQVPDAWHGAMSLLDGTLISIHP